MTVLCHYEKRSDEVIPYTETTAPIKRSRREPPAMQGGKKTLDSRIYKIYKKAPLC